MTPRIFWRCTPRKLAALSQIHSDLNDPKGHSKKQPMTVDGVPVRNIPDAAKVGGKVGTPNAFVDQIKLS